MDLPLIWFILIAVLWIGYLVLEGFDFGVGMLLPILDKAPTAEGKDKRRRLMINTIAPVWDGNEVWLITAGAAMFAAFPDWYATLFSGFYLPLLFILVALIVRGLAFDYRGKRNDASWRARWDAAIMFGSYTPALLWGVAFSNIVAGVPIDENKQFTGTLFTLLNPFALLGGVAFVALFMLHGAIFLALKTDGELRHDAAGLAAKLAPVVFGLCAAWAIWLQLASSDKIWTWGVVAVAAVALAAMVLFARARKEGQAFAATCVVIVGATILIFGAMWPNVMPSTTDPAYSLTVRNASSTEYTLTVMSWVALVLTPVVIGYQAWSYWVFRRRLTVDHIPDHAGLSSTGGTTTAP